MWSDVTDYQRSFFESSPNSTSSSPLLDMHVKELLMLVERLEDLVS